eukprot:scaffold2548_cov163-Ochromonas_danica.AAC.1
MHFCQSLIPTSFNRRSFVGQAGADLVEQALVQAFVDLDRVQRTVPVKEDSEGIEVINEAGCAAVCSLITPPAQKAKYSLLIAF